MAQREFHIIHYTIYYQGLENQKHYTGVKFIKQNAVPTYYINDTNFQ